MFLVVVDSYSKWIEAKEMSSIDSFQTVKAFRDVFSTFGIPNTLVTDNGPSFVSEEFETFCVNNGIKHLTTAPYHAMSNGLAENVVKTFKKQLVLEVVLVKL